MMTINNPDGNIDVDLESLLLSKKLRYAIWQMEMGEEGTNHIQAYLEFNKVQRLSAVKKLFPTAHFERRHGTRDQARDYCSKTESRVEGPWTVGEFRLGGQGSRTDLMQVADSIKQGYTLFQIADQHPVEFIKYHTGIEKLRNIMTPVYTSKYQLSDFNHEPLDLNRCVYIHGPSGTGKTQFALSHFKNPLLVRHIDDLKQLTERNDGIVFDDLDFSHWPVGSIIHLLDMDEASSINVKYGVVRIPANTPRIFTHNTATIFAPPNLHVNQLSAINRRLNVYIVEESLIKC